ncbi:MAG: hypothetical protein MH252_08380 [Thermosynechococcaceae cyanobacterium MS004]|nr:hypothetical protein [Thermosynechococcaceae cyanobacterium MS004]
MKAGTALATIIATVLCAEIVCAQYASSPQARELLSTLQDTRSATEVGISWLDYGPIARNIKIKLDRFLRVSDSKNHPAGYFLKSSADAYVKAQTSKPRFWMPSIFWHIGGQWLEMAEDCISGKQKCLSISEDEASKNSEDKIKKQ